VSERVFLDANILVSAAWRSDSGLLALWELPDVTLLTSAYAIVEADRNVETSEQRTRLHRLAQRLEIVDEPRSTRLPAEIRLPGKDVPILMAAIESAASYLLTGDREHFGAYFDKTIEGVRILRPAIYLKLRRQ
jgi:predicted nucleic acid-binding protein